MSKLIDLTGEVFGRLTVLERAENKGGRTAWLCKCNCGNEVAVIRSSLVKGKSTSCGCFQKERVSDSATTHGCTKDKSPTPEYTCWYSMIKRCYNENDSNYSNYGGRGIIVCEEWKDDFSQFLKNMGEKPSPDHSIDRIDVNGDYEPDNCRWANQEQQVRNQRIRRDNSTGFKGVHWSKGCNKYISQIYTNGKRIHLGTFDNLDDAVKAREKAEDKYWNKVG